ncbi:MAG: helix-turn-helix transcriptional regulator, partial [Nocardioidaceae bacterium]
MLTTSARLLRLLGLLQSRPMWSSAELAERLEITDRSVRRDVERLRELGYPVHASPGVGGGYRLGAGRALPPLLLDDEEAVAVAVSLRTAAGGTVTGVGESSVRALAKLEQVLPARLRAQVSALQAATEPMAAGTPPVDAASLVTLANACRDHERVRFDYVTHRGAQAERRAEPHRLVSTGRRWYLVARDVDRADWRSFRIDRMGTVVSTGLRFTPMDPPEDAVAFVSHGVSSAPYRYQARLRLHLPMEAA